jgi:hypothetical protein
MARDLDKPPTRAELNRLLVGNALTKPMPNIVVPALVAAGGLILGLGILAIVIAVVAWLALSAITYLDGDEAERVASEQRDRRRRAVDRAHPRVVPTALAPPIAQRLNAVLAEQSRISEAIERAELPFSEVAGEVDTFVRAAEKTASRAQLLYEYLSDHDPRAVEARLESLRGADDPGKKALRDAVQTQAAALQRGADQLDRFYTEMERIGVELGNVRAELLAVSAASEASGQQRLAEDVRDLREQMSAVSAGMSEALSDAPEAS